MDLVSILDEELNSKLKDATIIDKIYYIVKRMCEELQYDYRFLWAINDERLVKKIFDKEINVFNIIDKRVLCTSFSRAYAMIADTLLFDDPNYDVTLIEGDIWHAYAVTCLKDGTCLNIDAVRYTNDFLNVKKGLKLCAIKIKNNVDKDYLEEHALLKMKYNNSNLYLDYLNLLKKEILNNVETLEDEKLNEIFKFLINYTNFNNLGLQEAYDLILLSLTKILDINPKEFGFRKLTLYNKIINDNIVLYKVPKGNDEYEHYCMYLKNKKVQFSQINKPINDYVLEYEYDNYELKEYLKK